jgi:hypothetical protein
MPFLADFDHFYNIQLQRTGCFSSSAIVISFLNKDINNTKLTGAFNIKLLILSWYDLSARNKEGN